MRSSWPPRCHLGHRQASPSRTLAGSRNRSTRSGGHCCFRWRDHTSSARRSCSVRPRACCCMGRLARARPCSHVQLPLRPNSPFSASTPLGYSRSGTASRTRWPRPTSPLRTSWRRPSYSWTRSTASSPGNGARASTRRRRHCGRSSCPSGMACSPRTATGPPLATWSSSEQPTDPTTSTRPSCAACQSPSKCRCPTRKHALTCSAACCATRRWRASSTLVRWRGNAPDTRALIWRRCAVRLRCGHSTSFWLVRSWRRLQRPRTRAMGSRRLGTGRVGQPSLKACWLSRVVPRPGAVGPAQPARPEARRPAARGVWCRARWPRRSSARCRWTTSARRCGWSGLLVTASPGHRWPRSPVRLTPRGVSTGLCTIECAAGGARAPGRGWGERG
mmetsp:Transcript_10895/g.36103  ORF Transcript_10895/g.36103 Transcript_10895/m.36103 type:complete len:390 (-) Transcript_10895:398-1567(-)